VARKLQPLGDRVVVKPSEREEQTKSGLVLPDTAQERPQEGEVIAVGPGRVTDDGKRVPLDLKAGDKVVYSKFAGTEFSDEDEDYLILTERDILAKVG
jgi:chaperonin GroES